MKENKPTVRNTHILISISPETRMGVCEKCGPVKITKCGKTEEVQYWGCQYAHTRLDRNGNPKIEIDIPVSEHKATARNGHTLSSFDPETKSGNCERCGNTTIVKCGSNPGVQYWGCAFAYPRKSIEVNLKRHCLTEISEEGRTATCSQCGPTQIVKSGNAWRCRHASKIITAPLNVENYRKHRLAEINEETRRGVCEFCGPTDLVKNGKKDGKVLWKCRLAHVYKTSTARPRKHRLLEIDEKTKTGVCKECGATTIVFRKGKNGRSNYWLCEYTTRWVHLLRKYGVTKEQYKAMETAQGGCCLMCGEPDPELCVDHDHNDPSHNDDTSAKKKVRGLLCHRCNVTLGLVRDSVQTLQQGIRYLRRNSSLHQQIPLTTAAAPAIPTV